MTRKASGLPLHLTPTPTHTMTPCLARVRLVVIVRAGADADVGRGPLWSPWPGTLLFADAGTMTLTQAINLWSPWLGTLLFADHYLHAGKWLALSLTLIVGAGRAAPLLP